MEFLAIIVVLVLATLLGAVVTGRNGESKVGFIQTCFFSFMGLGLVAAVAVGLRMIS